MNSSDIAVLKLIDLLKLENKINSIGEFARSINILEQTISKIKKGKAHFTVDHIKSICKVYNVNANWIFSLDKKVYNTKNSIEIDLSLYS